MAKMLNYPKITVETDEEVYVFRAKTATISSVDSGMTHQLSVERLREVSHRAANTENATATPPAEPFKVRFVQFGDDTPPVAAAKKLEEGKLQAAAEAQEVQLRHLATVEALKHATNKAILAALHSGITAEALNEELETAGATGYMDRIKLVRDNEFGVLYGTAVVVQ